MNLKPWNRLEKGVSIDSATTRKLRLGRYRQGSSEQGESAGPDFKKNWYHARNKSKAFFDFPDLCV